MVLLYFMPEKRKGYHIVLRLVISCFWIAGYDHLVEKSKLSLDSREQRAKLMEYGVMSYKSYGSLKGLQESEIKQIIHQLLVDNLLVTSNDKYALLRVTALADEVINGTKHIILKKIKKFEEKDEDIRNGRKKSAGGLRRSDILNSRGMELFEQLRILRIEIAREKSVPPYIVFSDKTLVDMCVRAPLSREEMLRVSGVGENKFEQYGERFLNVITEYTGGIWEKFYFGELPKTESLGQISVGGGRKTLGTRKKEFTLTQEEADRFPYADRYLCTEIAERLNELRNADLVKKTSGAEIFRRLQAEGCVTEIIQDGIWRKVISDKGLEHGLFMGIRISKKGTEYEDVYCNERAQKWIVDMMR